MCVERKRVAYLLTAETVGNSVHELERGGCLFKGNFYNMVKEKWFKFLTVKYAQFMIIVALPVFVTLWCVLIFFFKLKYHINQDKNFSEKYHMH